MFNMFGSIILIFQAFKLGGYCYASTGALRCATFFLSWS